MSTINRTLKTRAVYYLSKRDYSRAELARKLAQPTYQALKNTRLNPKHTLLEPPTPDAIAKVLDDLQQQGFLNDVRFAQSMARRLSNKQGTAKVLAQLSSHQLDTQITSELAVTLKETELERCYQVWVKRFKVMAMTDNEPLTYEAHQAAYAKQGRFLIQRGFNPDVVRKILTGWQPDIDTDNNTDIDIT